MYLGSVSYLRLCITFPYRFHMIGLLVLFVQDIGDILLELSKSVLYFSGATVELERFSKYYQNISSVQIVL